MKKLVPFLFLVLLNAANAQTIHGIADVSGNFIIGGSTPRLWHNADFAVNHLQTDVKYRFYTLYSELPGAVCQAVYPTEPGGPPEPH